MCRSGNATYIAQSIVNGVMHFDLTVGTEIWQLGTKPVRALYWFMSLFVVYGLCGVYNGFYKGFILAYRGF